ncbi:hypothetical protein NC653_003806 [Populus alba x Populus x berolinensis]|uniref:Uncharacterized protein n=1 Tax=Populus alba x Populus x berolinensis TaxID=444605 RepID=A0AAD6RUF5_9ROSI|nr:hypothetical protein NC653_003806 [Populus alba x Populus x berolinensis]
MLTSWGRQDPMLELPQRQRKKITVHMTLA